MSSVPLPLTDFDSFMFHCINDLVGGALSNWSHLKASLPPRLGGLGIRRASAHSGAIFLSSVRACSPHILALSNQVAPHSYTLSAFSSCSFANLSDISSPEDLDVPIVQKSFSRIIDQAAFYSLFSSSPTDRSQALLLSTSIPHAGDWLGVLPSPTLGLHFLDTEFRLCLRYWLGLPLSSDSVTCPICTRPSDPLGDHALACGGNNDRVLRHNAIRDVIFTAAQSPALSPRREAPSLVPNSLSRPADVFLPHWSQGRPAALDVTVISSLQPQTLQQALSTQGSALAVAEQRKRTVHHDNCNNAGILFLPLAMETLGGWSHNTFLTLSCIGRHLANRFGLPPLEASHHLLQRLSVTLWRFNASMWLNRFLALPPQVDGLH